jgi:hypothetical protein
MLLNRANSLEGSFPYNFHGMHLLRVIVLNEAIVLYQKGKNMARQILFKEFDNLIPGFIALAVFSTLMAWILTLYLINAGLGYEANVFSYIIYSQPFLLIARNLALIAIVGYVSYLLGKKTKLGYIPIVILAAIFFFNFVHDLTNNLIAIRFT